MSISIQYSISETVTKVKYCNLDSCYFLFQNDPRFICIKQTLYFTWHQDLQLDPKPIQVKLESFDFNGICARPMSLCKSDFFPHTHKKPISMDFEYFFPSPWGVNLKMSGGEWNFRSDWIQILIERNCHIEIILMKWYFRKRL